MIRWLITKRLYAVEHRQGISLAYLRTILGVSLLHFFKLMKMMPLARFRHRLSPDVYHLARIVTVCHEDCGSSLPMEVQLAKQAGVSVAVLHAALDRNPCALPPDLAEVYLFAEAVATCNGAEEEFREAILRRYDTVGLVELSLAIAVCRVVPTLKHALGDTASYVPNATNDERVNR